MLNWANCLTNTTPVPAILHDLARSHSADFAEQAQQRQNDEVLEALLAEAEAGMRQVELAQRPCWPRGVMASASAA